MSDRYDLDGLRAAVEKATPGEWQACLVETAIYTEEHEMHLLEEGEANAADDLLAIVALVNAARSGLLDDAALGRAVRVMIVPPVDWVCECIPDAVIEAGMKAMEAADEDRAKPYVAGESIDWDEGMYVAAIFRAMLGALVATQEGR